MTGPTLILEPPVNRPKEKTQRKPLALPTNPQEKAGVNDFEDFFW